MTYKKKIKNKDIIYEQEKQKLKSKQLTAEEYEKAIKNLVTEVFI